MSSTIIEAIPFLSTILQRHMQELYTMYIKMLQIHIYGLLFNDIETCMHIFLILKYYLAITINCSIKRIQTLVFYIYL